MSGQPIAASVQFDGAGLVLVEERGTGGAYRFPRRGEGPDGTWCSLALADALQAGIRPVGTAETVLREWVRSGSAERAAGEAARDEPWDDPAAVEPVRVRAGAVVIRDDRMLLIRFEEDGEPFYEIPGGGVEGGETPLTAVVRELREETGLVGTVAGELAQVWKDGRREHYFLLDAEGETGVPEALDNHGGVPVWIPVARLAVTPVWPRRLAWRIAAWHAGDRPARPVELADSIHDLQAACTW